MKTDNYIQEQKYFKAKKRVEELKAYYWHLAIYVIINLFLSGSQIVDGITENKTFTEIFSDLGIYAVWFIWGIGLFFHTFKVFGFRYFIGDDWEERKIKEIMNNNN
jgi:hypothetical protein